jgi:SAM-dependent methyltransferase
MKKKNYLFNKMRLLLAKEGRGTLLDVGCGDGDFSNMAHKLGFQVTAADLNPEKFKYADKIPFRQIDLEKPLPFSQQSYDYVMFCEVVEHLENPSFAIRQFRQILKKNGYLYLSTPNILNVRSRLRFLMEGAFDFYREPPLEMLRDLGIKDLDLHLNPFRIHELEYLLGKNGFRIAAIDTDWFLLQARALCFLVPLIKLQMAAKIRRAKRKGGIDFSRIGRILLSPELLYGRHLIIKAQAE